MRWRAAPLALALLCACGGGADRAREEAARRERARLHQRLDELVARDPAVARALSRTADVQVAIRSEMVTAVVREVTRRYLDRVELDLPLEKAVDESGSVDVGTPLGRMTAGRWEADVVVHRVRGVLAAGTPRMAVAAGNTLRIELPVTVQKAQGSATVRFRWDARSVASVVCRDFEVSRTIHGRLLAQEYALAGSVRLLAGPRSVRAEPAFPDRRFRLRVDLLPESWQEVRAAVAEQDKLLRCGLAIEPGEVQKRLSALLRKGFELRLPRSLFRSVDLPGSVGGSVALAGRQVELTLATESLEVGPESVWYGASVSSRARPLASAAP